MPIKKSLYDIAENQFNQIGNKGYDYEGKIFENSMSHVLFNEDKRAGILKQMETIIYELIQSVKKIKLMYGVTMRKKYRDFN